MIISPEVLTIYIIDAIFILFASVAFVISVRIVKNYDVNATTALQYELEKKSYLVATIIRCLFYIKVPFFLFFIFILNNISFVLPGAMCGAGVVNSSSAAVPLLFLKLLNSYLFAYWILLDKDDMSIESQPYIKQKFFLYLLFYLLLITEIYLEFSMFLNIDVTSVVDCCGVIFSHTDGSYMAQFFGLPASFYITLFYGNFALLLLSYLVKSRYIFALLNLVFVIVALLSLIAFFGIYIYELPTHHCPFCLLQSEYNYVGYVLYSLLFLGTFNGVVIGLHLFSVDVQKEKMRYSLIFLMLYVSTISYYFLGYYLKNSVWL